MEGRTKSTTRNIYFSLSGQFIGILVSLISRGVFLNILTKEYLGLTSLFTNILTVISLVELGVGPAMSYSLYKPLADNNIEKVKSLMNVFKKAYIAIGMAILVLGLMCIPFYRFFIGNVPEIKYLNFIFYLFVLNTGGSYFFSYKRSLIICDQKKYIASIYRYSFYILLQGVQIFILFATKSYILFLVAQVLFTFLENYTLAKHVEKIYPYLLDKNINKLTTIEICKIKKNISAMLIHKLGGAVVNSTDNILIAKFFGLSVVGVYANYLLIINALRAVYNQLFNSILASVGNLNIKGDRKKKKDIFNKLFFANSWLYGFSAISLLCLLNPFINIWLGDGYHLDISAVLAIVISFYLEGMRKTSITFKDATGVFWNDRYRPLVEIVLNLVISIYCAMRFGIAGVFFGTIASNLATSWYETYIVYKLIFDEKLIEYYKRYIYYTMLMFVGAVLTFLSISSMPDTMIGFSIRVMGCLIIPNLIFIIFNYKSMELQFFMKMFFNGIKKIGVLIKR